MKKFLLIFLIAICPVFFCAFGKEKVSETARVSIVDFEKFPDAESYISALKKIAEKFPKMILKSELSMASIEYPDKSKNIEDYKLSSYGKMLQTIYFNGNKRRIEIRQELSADEDLFIESHCVYENGKSYHIYDNFYPHNEKVKDTDESSRYCDKFFTNDYMFEKYFFEQYKAIQEDLKIKKIGMTSRNGIKCQLVGVSCSNCGFYEEKYDLRGTVCISEEYGRVIDGEIEYMFKYNGMNKKQTREYSVTKIELDNIPKEKFMYK